MKRWFVYTPFYEEVVPVLDYGQGPIEHNRDFMEIEADSETDAIQLAVKYMLSRPKREFPYVHSQLADRSCPYTGIKAEVVRE